MASQESSLRLYRGNSVFRNQPSFKHFSSSFADPTDALYLGLNEIDPTFLCEEELLQDAKLFKAQLLVDPRNMQAVTEVCIDHTNACKPKIFRAPCRSKLTKAQHVVCLRVLQAWQNKDEVDDADLLVFRLSERKREKEKVQFLKYVSEFSIKQRERIYAPAKHFVELYSAWYQQRTRRLMEQLENRNYNTHTGLPHVKVCGSSEQTTEIVDVEVLERKGYASVWRKNVACKNMATRLKAYASMYVEEEDKTAECWNTKAYFTPEPEDDQAKHSCIFQMPLESLLFLMTAGDYLDLPTEMLLDITSVDADESKIIKFHVPLPARNCGWHTHNIVMEHAFAAYQAVTASIQWLQLNNKEVSLLPQAAVVENCNKLTEDVEFKPMLFEDYLKNIPTCLTSTESKLKLNQTLVKWRLQNANNSMESLQICTTMQQPPAADKHGNDFLGGFSIKLEYKPQFGCEVMTKYELLKEWLTLRLLSAQNEEALLHRLRIDCGSFETLLKEQLVRMQIELQLLENYAVRMPRLLNGVFEFLKILQGIPLAHDGGQYMLRFNAKFRDKLMLCAPAQEITQNTISLHALLQNEPSDLVFMTQHNCLPIADTVCSAMHSYHRVLPCAFLPILKSSPESSVSKVQKPLSKKSTRPRKIFNDRDFILSKVQQKASIAKAKVQRLQRRHKHNKRVRRRELLKKNKTALATQQRDEEELKHDIELDKMLFGFT